MSRHHTLPPIVYSPPLPEPKKTRPRRGVSHVSSAREADDAEEVSDGASLRSVPVLPQHARPVEATERRTPSPNGKLSDDTLRAMLALQEEEAK